MHYEILDESRIDLLQKICRNNLADGFYLAGGTALSLQLKLRESHDFDFFSGRGFNEDVMLENIRKCDLGELQVLQIGEGTLNLVIGGIQVSFLRYQYDMVEDFVQDDDMKELFVASPEDIAVMKLSAIGNRGARKDFFDLYQIYQKVEGYNSYKLVSDVMRKFGKERDLSYMAMGLTYFEDAEQEKHPKCFVEYNWEKIKGFFRAEQSNIMSIICG